MKRKKEIKRIDYDNFDDEELEEELEDQDLEEEQPLPKKKRAIAQPTPQIPDLPSGYVVKQVSVQTQPVVVNQKTNKQMDIYQALAEILNKLDE